MLVLISYDVSTQDAAGVRRLRNVAKACVSHGQHVQNSVFECLLSEAQLCVLRHRLEQLIDPECDSLRFYLLGNHYDLNFAKYSRAYVTITSTPLLRSSSIQEKPYNIYAF